ncbi:D-arabinono-1,4-lactone oxidase [Homoserinibacter sp. YIM 151385]|uniref:D-arabinono-1,4-lactone oxidase n=1 Tax=Homoserinibacter sp. YIM 151385 TaxID=2985506 RepID=UPI0022EFFDA8|nr:D-arabinono-1,4-lactone oxidase [Homoserinibacter sp. YIM 151385]WBU38966.1 FAD-binding protein [Homoserinibacter sp. YIM 151385]
MDAGRNWGRNLEYSARELHRPESVAALQAIVRASRGLRPLGSRHSFSAIADTRGDLVETSALPRLVELDEERRTVAVTGGLRYGELAPELDARGWALANLASLPHISIAGSIATGTHGSGVAQPSLAAPVAALELVRADGELARIERGDPGFEGAVVSLGALGVVTRVELDLVPAFRMRQQHYQGLSWDQLLEHLDELMALAYSVGVFTRWTGEDLGTLWVKSTEPLPDEVLGARPAGVVASRVDDGRGTELGAEGPWHERLPHFRLGFTPSNGDELQSEFMVPRAHAVEALEGLRRIAERIEPHLHATELRTVAAEGLWLSSSFEADVLSIGFTWKHHPVEVDRLIREVEEIVLPLGARPHWGKLDHATELDRLYPRLDDFRALADEWDPRGKLRNDYLDRKLFR